MQLEQIQAIIQKAKVHMEHGLEHLSHELIKIRTGKASTGMLEGLLVDYYGSPTPIHQVANISTTDARTLQIQPWEKSMLAPIEKAIFEANLGFTPMNNGEVIIINVPPLTEERRKDLVKKAKALAEESKVGIRSARRDAMEHLKKAQKDGLPEDIEKAKEHEIQNLTDQYIGKVDKMLEAKDKEIMTV